MSKKRFQECSNIEKAWRYRWYILIPFKWAYYMTIGKFIVIDDISNHKLYLRGKELWKVLIGTAQSRMRWYWTSEEVFSRINDKIKKGTT